MEKSVTTKYRLGVTLFADSVNVNNRTGQTMKMCIKRLDVKNALRKRTKCPHGKHRQHCPACDPVGYQYYLILIRVRNALARGTGIVSQDYLGCDIVTFMKHIQSQLTGGYKLR